MNWKKIAPYLLLVALLVVTLIIKNNCNQGQDIYRKETAEKRQSYKPNTNSRKQGLNRNPTHIHYSRHAQCRMGCRKITASEIKEILRKGTINYRKSSLNATECKKKYAIEGYSRDGQHIRIVVAPCADEITIVTCIDLEKEWSCDCD